MAVAHVTSERGRAQRLVNRARAPLLIEHNKMIIGESRNVPILTLYGSYISMFTEKLLRIL